MVKDKEGERGARFFLAVFTNFSGTILLLEKTKLNLFAFNLQVQ